MELTIPAELPLPEGMRVKLKDWRGEGYDYLGRIIGEGIDLAGEFWRVKIEESKFDFEVGTVDFVEKGCRELVEIL